MSCTAWGAIPISPSRPEWLQAGIEEAYRHGAKRIVIPVGVYRISPASQSVHLQFRNFRNFEIDASGAEFVFADQTRGGIEFHDCESVVLRGATVRYAVPPFTQGQVIGTASDRSWYDVRIDAGYPLNLDDPRFFPPAPVGYVFDRSGQWKRGAYDLYEKRTERKGSDVFRIYRQQASGSAIQALAVGDPVAFRGSGPHNITIVGSSRIRLDGVTIYNAGAFAVLESDGEGDNHYRIAVKRGPRPRGATADPLLSSTADAFHSVNVRKGPTLERCYFEGMADDGIAIHGTFSLVLESAGDKLFVSKSWFRPGDPLRLYDLYDRPAGEFIVKSVRALPGYQASRHSDRKTLGDNSGGPYFEITLNAPVKAGFDYLANNPASSGSGYVLRNNTITNHRARGMLLKADNGLVEDNTIDGSTMGGIVVAPEFWWNEAGYSRDVIIRRNTIRRVSAAPGQLGGVTVAALDDAPVPGCGHRHITIEGNHFEEIDGVNLLITSACDVQVNGNLFVRAQLGPAPPSFLAEGRDSGALIVVTQASVTFVANRVANPGAFHRRLIAISPDAHAEGLPAGVALAR